MDRVNRAVEDLWGKVPTTEDVKTLVNKMWDNVPTKKDLKKLAVLVAANGVSDVVGVAQDGWEALGRLAKHNPHVAAWWFGSVEGETFGEAFEKARKQGLQAFVWPKTGKVYSTEYNGTAQEQLDVYGIVNEQLQNPSQIAQRLGNNQRYFEYPPETEIKQLINRFYHMVVLNEPEQGEPTIAEKDYHNIYKGQPQKNGTLGISEYKPGNDDERNGKNLPPPDKIIYKDKRISEEISKYWAVYAKHLMEEDNHRESRFTNRELEHFKMSLGHDEKGYYIAYDDIWDLAPVSGGKNLDYGKPFEVYDRIYFDPDKIDEVYETQRKEMTEHSGVITSRYQYQEGCRKISVDFAHDCVRTYTYNDTNFNQLMSEIETRSGAVEVIREYTYDAKNNKIGEVWKDGKGKITNSFKYTYDANNNRIGEVWKNGEGKVTFSRKSTYDAKNNKIGEVCEDEEEGYYEATLDAAGHRVSWVNWDIDGNITGEGSLYEEALRKQEQQERKLADAEAEEETIKQATTEKATTQTDMPAQEKKEQNAEKPEMQSTLRKCSNAPEVQHCDGLNLAEQMSVAAEPVEAVKPTKSTEKLVRQIDNGTGIDEQFKSMANNGKGWQSEENVRDAIENKVSQSKKRPANKTTEKPYYGHRKGGIDDTIAKVDAQERAKMNVDTKING